MLVEPAKPADVASIVAIHCDALHDDVLPSLGPVFLHDFYSWAMTRPDQHLAVARKGDRIEGFCLLSLRPMSVLSSWMKRYFVAFGSGAASSACAGRGPVRLGMPVLNPS